MPKKKLSVLLFGLLLIAGLAVGGYLQPSFIPVMMWLMFGVAAVVLVLFARIDRRQKKLGE
jgi:hypothetical protein